MGEGAGGLAATDAAFAARVAWTTAWTIAFMSTFRDGAGDGTFGNGTGDETGGAWGSGIVLTREAKAGAEEATGNFCSHKGRREWSLWDRCNVMLVVRGKLHGFWISRRAACLFRSPWMTASPLARGVVG